MNKSELEQAIADQYPTSSRNFISDAEITRYLNREIKLLNGKIDLLTSVVEGTIAFTGNGTYTFSTENITDFKKPIALLDRTNNVVYRRVDKEELYSKEDSNIPVYSTQTQDTKIHIISPQSSATLTLIYYSTNDCKDASGTLQEGLSVSTDEPLLQAQHHDYLVEAVLKKMFRKERKLEDYQIASGTARQYFQDIAQDNATQEEEIEKNMTSYIEQDPSYDIEQLI